ncbi:MAG: S1C family serine protease [Oscillospiraceae bacterium]|nr:S1C family serine protease [Oscillospiraceae bacterium]
MFFDDEERGPIFESQDPPVEQNDRVNGEYHYKNGYTQRIYSDAHYVRADETTVPPRYYVPPEKPQKETKKSSRRKGVGLGAMIAACLICALLGGLGGGALVGTMMDARLDTLEENVSSLGTAGQKVQSAPVFSTGTTVAAVSDGSVMSAGDIYDMACQQVVGVTTDVVYTNFFGMTSSAAVTGSGFIISEDGYILTNYHLVEDARKGSQDVNVILHDGSRHSAQIVGYEADNDVAVLKIEASGLNAAVIGDSDALRVGDAVYAVGNPLGELDFSMTSGHVSAKDRVIRTQTSPNGVSMFQVDTPINSGNSGGPIYNDQGQVVGIVTAKPADTGVDGIGFAIPINDAAAIAGDLVTKGYVTGKAHLGVTPRRDYNEIYAQYFGLPMGVYVDAVSAGSCAEKAGIEAGDIITRFDGVEVQSSDELRAAIKRHSAGDSVELEIYHADKSRTVTVVLDEEKPN